ncbi:MAG TPA: protein translocase subunit SecD [Kofleriaceae bacterium]|nr:protein translocase subunit SecD [Kofleriaceae bacterium]
MDRNLKWRTIGLVGLIAFCLCTLAPTFVGSNLPTWFNRLFSKKINLGLDLQGGLHITYSIDLDRAVDDKASEIKRDLDSKFTDDPAWKDKIKGISAPGAPIGEVIIRLNDATKKAEAESIVLADYKDVADKVACPSGEPASSVCVQVSKDFAEGVRRAALKNAVNTIRERIDERGIAEPSVIEKGDDVIVELPGLDDESTERVKDLIKRTAKLEFKLVIDHIDGTKRPNEEYWMDNLAQFVKADPHATEEGIEASVDTWPVEDTNEHHRTAYLMARDRVEQIPVCEAKEIECWSPKLEVKDGKVQCNVTGLHIIERYVSGVRRCNEDPDPKLAIHGIADRKDLTVKDANDKVTPFDAHLPEGRQLGYEKVTPDSHAKDTRTYWRTYYLDRAVRLSGSAVKNAGTQWDPNTNKPYVAVEFDRYGGRLFGDLTSQNVGAKMAIILDDKINSAPIINGPIRGGNAQITMGGNDAEHMQKEADDLVSVLKTGSLPAPLKEESSAQVGPTLGRDAIQKAQLSFIVGVVLVIVIMLGIYKWSGWVAIGAVTINVLMMMTAMTIFGATLTLPGIAALVLTVGMGVDGNILIYERIRDELTLGKSVRGAVDVGFSRAFTAILDGHMTTAAGGWVLLQYGSGPIKGFAVMLLVGIGTTLFCSTVVTRIFFDWVVARKKGNNQTISI